MAQTNIIKRRVHADAAAGENIEEPAALRARLARLCDAKLRCDVVIGAERFSSMFLKLAGGLLITDALTPLAGNDRLQAGQRVRIRFFELKTPFTVDCTYAGRTTDEGFDALAFAAPAVIRQANRRTHYRVRPDAAETVRVIIDYGERRITDAEVVNISGGGLAVKSRRTGFLRPRGEVDRLDVLLPGGGWMTCRGTVARMRGATVGIKFDSLSRADRRGVIRYVAQRQRQEIALAADER